MMVIECDLGIREEILGILDYGVDVFSGLPPPKLHSCNHHSVYSCRVHTQQFLDAEVSLGHYIRLSVDSGFSPVRVLPMALLPKKDPGKYRLIVDGSFPEH